MPISSGSQYGRATHLSPQQKSGSQGTVAKAVLDAVISTQLQLLGVLEIALARHVLHIARLKLNAKTLTGQSSSFEQLSVHSEFSCVQS